jgi:hypothetical protein
MILNSSKPKIVAAKVTPSHSRSADNHLRCGSFSLLVLNTITRHLAQSLIVRLATAIRHRRRHRPTWREDRVSQAYHPIRRAG